MWGSGGRAWDFVLRIVNFAKITLFCVSIRKKEGKMTLKTYKTTLKTYKYPVFSPNTGKSGEGVEWTKDKGSANAKDRRMVGESWANHLYKDFDYYPSHPSRNAQRIVLQCDRLCQT